MALRVCLAGAMSAETRDILQDALADPTLTPNPRQRVLRMLWLVSLAPEAEMEGLGLDDILRRIFEKVEVPR